MSKSMLNPPEREQYGVGGKIIEFGVKLLKPLNKGQEQVKKATEAQAVTAKAQGRAFGYGGVIGGVTVGLGGLTYSNISENELPSIMEKAKAADIPLRVIDERINPEDYPVYKKGSDSAKAFRQAQRDAKQAGADFFEYEGRSYNTTEVRKGKAEGSIISEEDEAADRANRKAKHTEYRSGPRLGELLRQGKSEAEAEQQVEAEADEQFGDAYSFMSPQEKAERAQQSQAEETRRRDDEANVNFYRQGRAEGSLMMPAEGMPVDTYDNIPPEEMDEATASQLPDDEMEDSYTSYVMDESLDDEEQEYLAGVLQSDPRLSDILDKVITVASEFSGAGEVDGPGTGVSDSIPARLSDGEFVITKKATDQIGADNLQLMMDDAERAYDGGYQMKALGGYMQEDPEQQDSPLSQTDEEIKKLMMGANKMPSLR